MNGAKQYFLPKILRMITGRWAEVITGRWTKGMLKHRVNWGKNEKFIALTYNIRTMLPCFLSTEAPICSSQSMVPIFCAVYFSSMCETTPFIDFTKNLFILLALFILLFIWAPIFLSSAFGVTLEHFKVRKPSFQGQSVVNHRSVTTD